MVSLLCHLHFWTLKTLSPGTAAGSDIGTHVYHEKAAARTAGLLEDSRKEWAQGRGIMWVPQNKKPERLRDNLRECEELLSTHQPVAMKWKNLRHCLVLLDNGTLLTYTVARHSGDVERIFLDKSLISRLGVKVDNALLLGTSLLLTTRLDHQLIHVSVGQKKSSSISSYPASTHNPLTLTHSDSGRKLEKLSAQDLKLTYVDVEGLPTAQVRRHLTSNRRGDLVVMWWRDVQEGGWTWSSMAHGGTENLLTFTLTGGKLEFCSGLQTDHDPVSVTFSKTKGHILYSLEQTGSMEYTPCTYEFTDRRMVKIAVGPAFTSAANITASARNKIESLLLLGCENGSLILYDSTSSQGQVKQTKAFFSPISEIHWHPAGTLAFVCSPVGEVQCYDVALNPLLFQTLSEDPSPSALLNIGQYFIAPVHLQAAGWGSEQGKGEGHAGCYDNFLMVFSNGPLVMLRLELGVLSRGQLGPAEVVSEYIRLNKLDEAISVLERLNWKYQQNDCFSCLTIIVNHLLIQPLTSETEYHISAALSTFLSPSDPQSISPQILTRYSPHVLHLQRRFFHLLFRYGKLERAYELAKTIQAKDLFMDVHFLALDLKELEIAEAARQKAEDLYSTESVDSALSWFGLEGIFSTLSQPSSSSSSRLKLLPPSPGSALGLSPHHQLRGATDSEEDIKHALHAVSLLSFEDSFADSYSPSPLAEQAAPFHSDHSATPSHSEVDDYSDNEATQEEAS